MKHPNRFPFYDGQASPKKGVPLNLTAAVCAGQAVMCLSWHLVLGSSVHNARVSKFTFVFAQRHSACLTRKSAIETEPVLLLSPFIPPPARCKEIIHPFVCHCRHQLLQRQRRMPRIPPPRSAAAVIIIITTSTTIHLLVKSRDGVSSKSPKPPPPPPPPLVVSTVDIIITIIIVKRVCLGKAVVI